MLPTLWKTSWATKRSSKWLCLRCRRKFQRGTKLNQYSIIVSNQISALIFFVGNIIFLFLFRPVARISQQGAPKTTKRETFFKYNIGYMQQPGDRTWNVGQILNGGQGTTGPAGDGPVFIVRIRVYFGVQSDIIWNHWMGDLHVTVEHRHLSRQCRETGTLLIAVSHVWLCTV